MMASYGVAALIISLGLAGCQSTAAPGPEGTAASGVEPAPSNYRQLIIQEMKSLPDFARGIREPEISNPGVGWGGLWNGSTTATVCIRYKTQGALLLGYSRVDRAFFFANGKVANNGPVNAPVQYMVACGGERRYTPFPEIEHNV